MKSSIDKLELIDPVQLRHELTAIAQDSNLSDLDKRRDVLKRLKEVQSEGREKIRECLEAGEPGSNVVQALCFLQDEIIRVIYDYITAHIYRSSNPTEAERLSIVAVGGYGRGDLAPGSDLDLLFVLPYKQTPWGENVIEYMLYLLWDLGLKVGHATRTVQQCVTLSREDMTIRTALLESRYLWGDTALYEKLYEAYWEEIVPGTDKEFIDAKLGERDTRHQRAGESRYLVEPNIKEGKGGLRDLHSLYWIAKYVYRVNDPKDLVANGLINEFEYSKVLEAFEFYWSVRCHLHFYTGRAEERLTFDVQPEIARRMKFEDTEGQSAVEAFMKAYFRIAKNVGGFTRIFCAALEASQGKSGRRFRRLFSFKPWRGKLEKGFELDAGRLTITSLDVLAEEPINMLRLFHIADEKSYDIHPNALKMVARNIRLVNEELRADPAANRLFLDILTSPRDPEWALKAMSEAGVLGRFILDFGKVEAMMQFNMYHHYTVDEHTLNAIGILSRIESGELSEEHPLANEIVHKVLSREVLYVALFLHDIAKGRKEDHSIAGAEVARELCPRLGLSSVDTDTVAWLVENHLFMSEFAQSRDISDPKTIEAFAKEAQSPERLRLLLVLTVADIRAVGPGVWNGWKGQLLRDLYYESESVLKGEGSAGSATQREGRVNKSKATLKELINAWPEDKQAAALDVSNDAYWLSFDSRDHERYARLMGESLVEGDDVAIAFNADSFMSITEVAIYAADKRGLFAKLSGALAANNASIMDAKLFSMPNSMALDIFYIQDATGRPFDDKSRLSRLEKMITQTVAGTIDPAEHVSRPKMRRRDRAFVLEPQVLIDNKASDIHTLIEVSGRDRPGLLFDLARVLVDLRLSIASAHISTYGERAVDVFYVKDRAGLKVTQEESINAIKKRLEAAMRDQADSTSIAAAE